VKSKQQENEKEREKEKDNEEVKGKNEKKVEEKNKNAKEKLVEIEIRKLQKSELVISKQQEKEREKQMEKEKLLEMNLEKKSNEDGKKAVVTENNKSPLKSNEQVLDNKMEKEKCEKEKEKLEVEKQKEKDQEQKQTKSDHENIIKKVPPEDDPENDIHSPEITIEESSPTVSAPSSPRQTIYTPSTTQPTNIPAKSPDTLIVGPLFVEPTYTAIVIESTHTSGIIEQKMNKKLRILLRKQMT